MIQDTIYKKKKNLKSLNSVFFSACQLTSYLLLMSMKGCIREAFAIILSKKLAVTQSDMVDLVARATTIHPLPLLWRLLSFPGIIK